MSKRIPRVNQLLKKELGQIILKEIDFPKDVLVTITRVETLPNLSESRVFISVFPEKISREILEILRREIYFLQQKINKRLKMRPLPRLLFVLEKMTVEAGRIEEILEKLKSKR
ncbi:30S ribosome-binding factor RbfA [Patescibacteria group bacterium]|nr:30S ribosome-binding factor RbfA [Patescibacteria group bacterium]MBU4481400.1 30S ribosome-binding factor RbfA [Patescibacteria group bacterium]